MVKGKTDLFAREVCYKYIQNVIVLKNIWIAVPGYIYDGTLWWKGLRNLLRLVLSMGVLESKHASRGDVSIIVGIYEPQLDDRPQNYSDTTDLALAKGCGLMFCDIIYLIAYDQWSCINRALTRHLHRSEWVGIIRRALEHQHIILAQYDLLFHYTTSSNQLNKL